MSSPRGERGLSVLAIGVREEFTVEEWASIPFRVFSIHLWDGQSPLLVFGLPIVASAVAKGVQTLVALSASTPDGSVSVTAFLVIVPALVGLALVRLGLRTDPISVGRRIGLIGLAALGVFTWGGLLIGPPLVGPLVAILGELAPARGDDGVPLSAPFPTP